jgi:NADPH:quinone reductase
MKQIRQMVLVSRPGGMLRETDFAIRKSENRTAGPGELLVRTLYLSADPYMRPRMNEGPSSFALGEPIRGNGLGVVEESADPMFKAGDIVSGMFEWADYTVLEGNDAKIAYTYGAPLTALLGVLGLTGLTAYFGMLDFGKPQKGETVLISSAAGAVGSIAGQIAKIKGCRVVGITGSDEKVKIVREELGFDGVINYKKENLGEAISRFCPKGVDIYFDNVGGEITDEVLQHINLFARIVICGQISQYNLEEKSTGPRPFPTLLFKSAIAQGIMVRHHADRFDHARDELAAWLKQGTLHARETVVTGLENAPRALIGIFNGENIGKQIVKVSEP